MNFLKPEKIEKIKIETNNKKDFKLNNTGN